MQWVLITWRFIGGYKWDYEVPLRGSCKGFYRVFRVWGFGGGSWVGVISPLIRVITTVTLLTSLLITTKYSLACFGCTLGLLFVLEYTIYHTYSEGFSQFLMPQ